jgi:hypothetical protein
MRSRCSTVAAPRHTLSLYMANNMQLDAPAGEFLLELF